MWSHLLWEFSRDGTFLRESPPGRSVRSQIFQVAWAVKDLVATASSLGKDVSDRKKHVQCQLSVVP